MKNDQENPLKKSKIPYIFFAFFGVILVVNIFYIYLSKTTWRGLATEDSYQKGLNYNQTIKQVAAQKELGWKLKIKIQPLLRKTLEKNEPRKINLVIQLEDKNLQVINDATISVEFKRPTQEGFDFSQNINFSNGVYQAEITFPLKGQWDFVVLATKDEKVFQEVKRYVIQ
jgi:nitrogen fixation protein FixH